jgi:hypothetical protein
MRPIGADNPDGGTLNYKPAGVDLGKREPTSLSLVRRALLAERDPTNAGSAMIFWGRCAECDAQDTSASVALTYTTFRWFVTRPATYVNRDERTPAAYIAFLYILHFDFVCERPHGPVNGTSPHYIGGDFSWVITADRSAYLSVHPALKTISVRSLQGRCSHVRRCLNALSVI